MTVIVDLAALIDTPAPAASLVSGRLEADGCLELSSCAPSSVGLTDAGEALGDAVFTGAAFVGTVLSLVEEAENGLEEDADVGLGGGVDVGGGGGDGVLLLLSDALDDVGGVGTARVPSNDSTDWLLIRAGGRDEVSLAEERDALDELEKRDALDALEDILMSQL